MVANANPLAQQLAALNERFVSIASKLGQAARELQASGTLPPAALAEELAALRRDFFDLRTGTLDVARALGVGVPGEVETLTTLEPIVQAVVAAIGKEERRQAAAEHVKRAVAVLDRVLAVVHADDPRFAALQQCQAKARELHRTVSDPEALGTEDPASLVEGVGPFAALLSLIDRREQLDDEEFAALEDGVSQSFGRPLAVAATRGKLRLPGAAGSTRAPAAARPAPPSRVVEDVIRATERPPQPSVSVPAAREVVAAARAAGEEAGAAHAVEQATQDEGAQWWVSAWARWTSWKSTLSFNDAVKQEVQKYSYLLSVPIQKSTDYEEGLLAYGYSILLEFLERHNAGVVNKALNSLKTFTPARAESVGAHLYSFLVAEGRLAELYPEFVKSVLVAAVPEPGVWTQARILESTVETRVFTHPSARIGDTEHNSQRLTQDRQRFTDHRFPVVLTPLTARFFAVAGDLREARVVDVKLLDGRDDSDRAWLLTMPPAGRADLKSELVRLAPEGTSMPGLGREYATLWIAVFNADPEVEKRYELILSLRKEAGTKPAGTARSIRA